MNVEIVNFPATKVAVVEHLGPQETEYESVKKLISWRIENKIPFTKSHRNYGVHYNDPNVVAANKYRVDLCLSVENDVEFNSFGVITKLIPACRCAKVVHLGSRDNVDPARYLYSEWLPNSNEKIADFPIFFHYVNVGPNIKTDEMLTDVYLPIL